jgi:hypothetical protein
MFKDVDVMVIHHTKEHNTTKKNRAWIYKDDKLGVLYLDVKSKFKEIPIHEIYKYLEDSNFIKLPEFFVSTLTRTCNRYDKKTVYSERWIRTVASFEILYYDTIDESDHTRIDLLSALLQNSNMIIVSLDEVKRFKEYLRLIGRFDQLFILEENLKEFQ